MGLRNGNSLGTRDWLVRFGNKFDWVEGVREKEKKRKTLTNSSCTLEPTNPHETAVSFCSLILQNKTVFVGLFHKNNPLQKSLHVFSSPRTLMRPGCVGLITLQHTLVLYMGRLRLVGSLKLQVSFAKEPYKRDYILRKRPGLLRNLLIVATP